MELFSITDNGVLVFQETRKLPSGKDFISYTAIKENLRAVNFPAAQDAIKEVERKIKKQSK